VVVCCRSRLPKGTWERPFKLTKKSGGDNQLPIAHTCFFQVGEGLHFNVVVVLSWLVVFDAPDWLLHSL
jgi:hypothetical protein